MSTERQRSLQMQMVLFWGAAIIVGALGYILYIRLMPAFDIETDVLQFMNAMMYATMVSVVFAMVASILVVIGIVKLVQYLTI